MISAFLNYVVHVRFVLGEPISNELRYENRQVLRESFRIIPTRDQLRDPINCNKNISGGWITIAITKPKQISKSIW